MKEETHLTLYRGWPTPGKHVWSPFVVKLEARLRLAGVPYTAAAGSPMTAPRGKIPYVEARGQPLGAPWATRQKDGETVASLGDSGAIIRALVDQGVVPDLNARLSAGERAHDLALRALLEDKLYFYHTRERWVDNYYTMRDHALGAIPYPLRVVVGLLAYRRIAATLHGQGTGRFTNDELRASKSEIWESIDGLLRASRGASAGDGPFWVLGGEEPTEADATLFGFVVSVLISTAGPESKEIVRGFPVVVEYARRIHDAYFPDYEEFDPEMHLGMS